jgi:hypothetical protein
MQKLSGWMVMERIHATRPEKMLIVQIFGQNAIKYINYAMQRKKLLVIIKKK